MEGFYAGFFTGALGSGFGIFIFAFGKIVGVDVGRVKFDGEYQLDEVNGTFLGQMSVIVPPNTVTVNAAPMTGADSTYSFKLALSKDFSNGAVQRIETPFGPVNARFERLRGLGKVGEGAN